MPLNEFKKNTDREVMFMRYVKEIIILTERAPTKVLRGGQVIQQNQAEAINS